MIRWPYKWRKKETIPCRIPHAGGLVYKWDCLAENIYIKLAKLPICGVNKKESRTEKLIISLTTFPARINQCYYAIKSLMLQDCRADKIILWLAESQFPGRVLPQKFQSLIDAGLTIRYCEDDYRSHKKYYYALQEQKKNELVITFDDDIIYESDAISKLVQYHKMFPECIVCNRGFQMIVKDGAITPYSKWKLCSDAGVNNPSYDVMPSTGAGCLYPYGIMPKSTFDISKAKEVAFSADDLWMRFNSLEKGVKVVKTRKEIATLCNVYGSQKESLATLNDIKRENDRVIERLVKMYPYSLKLLLEES